MRGLVWVTVVIWVGKGSCSVYGVWIVCGMCTLSLFVVCARVSVHYMYLYAVATHSIVFFKYVSICGGNALCMRWQRTQLFCSNMHLYAVATHSVCGGNALNHFFSNTKLPICIDSFAKETWEFRKPTECARPIAVGSAKVFGQRPLFLHRPTLW